MREEFMPILNQEKCYAYKPQLLESLGTLYALFTHSQTTHEQKQMIASGIAEDVHECTPGFNNRENFLITRSNLPQNMDELISLARFHLVSRIQALLQPTPQGVNVHNRVIEIARIAGYRVWPLNTQDVYRNAGSSNLNDKAIIETLQTGFANHFQLFALLNALCAEIEAIIALHGYQGMRALDNAYKEKDYSKWKECINAFIPIVMVDLLEFDTNSNKLTNIHWPNVKRALLQKLRNEDYAWLSKEEAILLANEDSKHLVTLIPHGYELAQCLVFFSDWRMEQKAALVHAYLESKSTHEQKEVLAILHNEAPQLMVELKKEPIFQAINFAIAMAEKDVASVRAYVEKGGNINEALPVLFSQEHKHDSLYWFHDHPHLLQTMTVAGMNTVITQGKYKDKTVAETLASTKKGRQLLSENQVLQTLFSQASMSNRLSDSLQQAQTERNAVNGPVGFFKKPNPKTLQLVQYIAHGDMTKSEELLREHPALLKTLLTEKVTVIDYSRRKVKQKTAFQAALCAMDDELCAMLAQYMTKEDIASQYQAIFPKGHEAYFQDQKSFDFSQIVETISKSSADDVKKALDLELPNTTALWQKLEQFRTDFGTQSCQEQVFNPQHLIKAFELYDSHYDSWNDNQKDLFWQQVIGYVQRFLPANIAMDFAQGLYSRVEAKQKSKRSFEFTCSSGSIFPLDFATLSGLGYEYAGGASARGCRWRRGAGLVLCQSLCQAKKAVLGELCSQSRLAVIHALEIATF